jgi:hypothetical protein
MTSKERRIVIGILVAFAAFAAWLNGANPKHMEFVCQEDGFVEYSQAFLYLFASVLFAYVGTRKGHRNIFYWGYALLFCAIAGEEVSWGQRIFDIATPASLDAMNVQHETTLHNINGLHQHTRMVGFLVCIAICYAIPLAEQFVPAARDLVRRFDMPIFPAWLSALPAIGFAFSIVPRLRGGIDFNLDEMGELYLAMAFFGFGLCAYRDAVPAIEPAAEPQPDNARMATAVSGAA